MSGTWTSAFPAGPIAARPTVGTAPAGTFQMYFATDTGELSITVGPGNLWRPLGQTVQIVPIAKTGDATLTVAEIFGNGLVNVTSASAVALTLPTGTLTDAGILSGAAPVGYAFEWIVRNLGSSSGAITMTANTNHIYTGSATVAITTSARFRTVKLATNSYQTARL